MAARAFSPHGGAGVGWGNRVECDCGMQTPSSLLQRLRQPDHQEAWGRFVELYTPFLYYWARGAGLQEADAADLVQDVLAVLLRKLPEFDYDRQQSFRGWLRTIAVNKWREGLRRRRPVLADDAVLEAVPAPDAMAAFEEAEYRTKVVRRGLEALRGEFPATVWKTFQEYVLAERPPGEVARELGLSVNTVYAAKSKVLSRLREELEGLLD